MSEYPGASGPLDGNMGIEGLPQQRARTTQQEIHVAPGGKEGATGAVLDPVSTIEEAVSMLSNGGGTIVIHDTVPIGRAIIDKPCTFIRGTK